MRYLQDDGSWISINHLENSQLDITHTAPNRAASIFSEGSFSSVSYISTQADDSDSFVDYDPSTGRQIYARFPIRDYIHKCALPVYEYKDKRPLLELKDQKSSMRWSTIASLGCFPLPRALRSIERYGSQLHVSLSNDPYFENYDEENLQYQRPLQSEFRRRFLLPLHDIARFGRNEKKQLNDVQNDEELCQLFYTFVLGTATEAVRFMRCLEPEEDPGHQAMAMRSQFYIRNNLFMDPYSMWNIFSLRNPSEPEAAPLIVVFIEPSRFGVEDFDRFVEAREINHGELDRPSVPADIIWAVIFEALQKGQGYKFVLTNYVRWAFGLFEPGYTKASVTEIYEAKLMELNGKVHQPSNEEQGNNVIEMLIRWMETPLTKRGLERFIQSHYPNL